MTELRRRRFPPASALLAMFGIAGLSSCDAGPSGPSGTGVITVVVTSPNGPEGSAVLEVSGAAALGPVTSASGDVFFEPGVSATRIVVLLDTPGQIRFEMRSDDVGTVPQVTLVQVADGNDGLRASLSGYQIDLARIPDASVAASRRRP